MPCDLGYKTVAKVTIPAPVPQEFKEEVSAPVVDAELLEKIGVDDPEFLEWLLRLDMNPLLAEALEKAKAVIPGSKKLSLSIGKDGRLILKASYMNESERKQLKATSQKISERYQMEVLSIVAQLLDYRVSLFESSEAGKQVLTLEGEKDEASEVHKYLRVTRSENGNGELRFEHFRTGEERDTESKKFLALAQKLGVTITVGKYVQTSGSPIPGDAVHKHFLHGEK